MSADTTELTRQAFCARMGISESTARRLERDGMPCTPIGRSKRYNLAECKTWLRNNQNGQQCQAGSTNRGAAMLASQSPVIEFINASKLVRRRVMPSALRLL